MNTDQRFKKRKKSRAEMCECPAYPFGHRIGGGKCNREHLEPQITTVAYHHSRQAMIDAGHSEKDFA